MGTTVCLRHSDRETEPRACVWVALDGRPEAENICLCCDECREVCRIKEPKADWPPLDSG